MDLKQALESLDPAIDDFWTADGSPRVDAVSEILGYETTRGEITEANPMLTRSSAPAPIEATEVPLADTEVEPEPAPVQTEVDDDREAFVPTEPGRPLRVRGQMTDAERSAHVEIVDDVVGMSTAEVYGDPELTQRASDEFGRQVAILTARKEAIAEKLKDVSRRSAIIDNALNRQSRGKNGKSQDHIRNYLDSQKESREARALKAQKFIEAGTNAEDVAEQLRGASKLDQSLKARKRQTPGSVDV